MYGMVYVVVTTAGHLILVFLLLGTEPPGLLGPLMVGGTILQSSG